MHVPIVKQGLRLRWRISQLKSDICPPTIIQICSGGCGYWTCCSIKELIRKMWIIILSMSGWSSLHEKIYISVKCCHCYYIQKVQKALKALTFLVQNITCSFWNQQRRHKMSAEIARNCLVLNSDAYFLSLGKINNH